jgi:hypothetical protein
MPVGIGLTLVFLGGLFLLVMALVDRPLKLLQNLEESIDMNAQEDKDLQNAKPFFLVKVTVPEGILICFGNPALIYHKCNYTTGQGLPNLPRAPSIQALRDFSSQHQELNFLAVNLLWSK